MKSHKWNSSILKQNSGLLQAAGKEESHLYPAHKSHKEEVTYNLKNAGALTKVT